MGKPALAAVPAAALGAVMLFSQQPQEPAFEVASVKPSAAGAGRAGRKGGPGAADPGLFTAHNRTLKALILMAYDVPDYQLSGGPAWTETDRFDVDARPPEAASRERMMLMLRTLLADRFQLRFHRETKSIPAFTLSVARNGPKFGPQFHKAKEAEMAVETKPFDPSLGINLGGPMKDFAWLLRSNMGIIHPDDPPWGPLAPPVIDQTGLEGSYVIYLRISGPKDDLPAAVQEQLGLRLDLRKLPQDLIVIDQAVKPSAN